MIGDVLQPTHLIFILVVALLVLGPKRLPEVGRSLGKGIRDFRGALSGTDDHASSESEPLAPPVAPVTPATTSVEGPHNPDAPTPPVLATTPVPPASEGEVTAPVVDAVAEDETHSASSEAHPVEAAAQAGQAGSQSG